jgi:hypothetical protein
VLKTSSPLVEPQIIEVESQGLVPRPLLAKTMAKNATSAWITADMAAAASYNSSPFCG